MRLVKPDWVNHDGNPIFSIDIHPDGSKFATGGQGNDAGQVIIWNLLPVIDKNAEKSDAVTKKLCQLDNHVACVNCVRWSEKGTTLASGGDDKFIMLWNRSKIQSAVFGNSGITKSAENWKCTHTLRGHAGDILDLAWSPQDRWLASSSVDNNIIIWDVQNSPPSMVITLRGHTGLVKGVTWDPVGKFLASQSDDRTVKVWRTSDFTCKSTIKEPFEECGGTTHVLRLSWSPDGLYLVSAHAMNGGGPTAQIIEREGWKCNKDFVGHRKAVTCVRFHRSILKRQESVKKYCCLAIGSRDSSLSVWLTTHQRPLCVIYDLFKESILDLSWSKNILAACSTDGSIAILMFTEEELGTSLSHDDKNLLYQQMYGRSANINLNESSADQGMVIEYSELLDADENRSNADAKAECNLNSSNISNSKSETQIVEDEISAKPVTASQNQTPTKAIHKQIETRRADGKRRITPMFIPLSNEQEMETSAETTIISTTTEISNTAFERKMKEQILKGQVVFDSATDITTHPTIVSIDATSTTIQTKANNNNDKQLNARLTKVAPIKTNAILDANETKAIEPAVLDEPSMLLAMRQNISAGKAVPYTSEAIKKYDDVEIKVKNGFMQTQAGPLSKITGTLTNNQWETYIGSPVVNFCLCAKYILICSLDCTLRFLDIRNGTPILPTLHMAKPAIQCVFSINSELGGIITECGNIRVWNLMEKKIFVSASCHDLFSDASTAKLSISFFHVSEVGILYVMLSNGCSYSYNKNLESWVTLNSRDPITRLGISSSPNNPKKTIKSFPLGLVQSASQNLQPNARNLQDVSNLSWQDAARLSFIENQIKICESIRSPVELEHWYSVLGSHLAQHGTEQRIRVHLDYLLDLPSEGMFIDNGEPEDIESQDKNTILGIPKCLILQKILNQLRTVPKWQRIYVEYNCQLENIP